MPTNISVTYIHFTLHYIHVITTFLGKKYNYYMPAVSKTSLGGSCLYYIS